MDHVPQDEVLDRMRLDVGATRPAMAWGGFPWIVLVPVAVVCFEVDVILGDRMAFVVDPPLAFAIAVAAWRDYNAPRIWGIWLQTSFRIIDAHFHGGAAVSPFPVKLSMQPPFFRKPKRARGIPSNAW
jgi:type IV secretory pathway VirB3-like protein